ncbi:MAG: HEPN domain-containing protein [Bacillota bacterium]|jgi:HEPN domain-containing protein|nr:HEPN domain-containing protein [Bacillota bacterium]
MDSEELAKYWMETAEKDYITMRNLYETGDYHWALFMGHLVLEKLLKACYVKMMEEHAPRVHDLLRLANLCKLEFGDEMADYLDMITTFNINARYPDLKQAFYKKCTQEFADQNITKIEEVRAWLNDVLQITPEK